MAELYHRTIVFTKHKSVHEVRDLLLNLLKEFTDMGENRPLWIDFGFDNNLVEQLIIRAPWDQVLDAISKKTKDNQSVSDKLGVTGHCCGLGKMKNKCLKL